MEQVKEENFTINQLKDLLDLVTTQRAQKEVISIEDMMVILDCKYAFASQRIREVKHISNILDIAGVIHIRDWETYLDYQQKLNRERRENEGLRY